MSYNVETLKIKIGGKVRSMLPPIIANVLGIRYGIIDKQWYPIDDKITVDDLRKFHLPYFSKVITHEVIGSDGITTYTVTISENNYSCTCPGYKFRTICKHINLFK